MCEQTLIHTCSQEYPGSARCVQSFDDSLDSAIRITYRISLRSSSMREPRHPSLKVVWHSVSPRRRARSLARSDARRTHARGSDWSQSRNGGRFKRLLFVVYDIEDRLRSSQRDDHRTYNRVPRHIPQSLDFGMDVFV